MKVKLNIKALRNTLNMFKGKKASKQEVQEYYIKECERLINEKKKC